MGHRAMWDVDEALCEARPGGTLTADLPGGMCTWFVGRGASADTQARGHLSHKRHLPHLNYVQRPSHWSLMSALPLALSLL